MFFLKPFRVTVRCGGRRLLVDAVVASRFLAARFGRTSAAVGEGDRLQERVDAEVESVSLFTPASRFDQWPCEAQGPAEFRVAAQDRRGTGRVAVVVAAGRDAAIAAVEEAGLRDVRGVEVRYRLVGRCRRCAVDLFADVGARGEPGALFCRDC